MNGSWTETRLTRLEQAISDVMTWMRSLSIGNSKAQQGLFTAGSVIPVGGSADGKSRFVQPTGPVSGGVYPGVIVERTSGGSWVSTGEVIEILAL